MAKRSISQPQSLGHTTDQQRTQIYGTYTRARERNYFPERYSQFDIMVCPPYYTVFLVNQSYLYIDNYRVTEETIISLNGEDIDHPLFGKTKRYGWVTLQKSDEYTFAKCYHSKKIVKICLNSKFENIDFRKINLK